MRKLENTWTCNFRLRKVVKLYNQHDFWQVQTLIIWKFCPSFLIKIRLEGSTIKSVIFFTVLCWKLKKWWKYSFMLQKVVKVGEIRVEMTWDTFSVIFLQRHIKKHEHVLEVVFHGSASHVKEYVSARSIQKYQIWKMSFLVTKRGRGTVPCS